MIQHYIEQSTKKVRHTVEQAIGEMAALQQNILTPDFILLALLSQPESDALKILKELIPNEKEAISRLKGEVYQHYKDPIPSKSPQLLGSPSLEAMFQVALEQSKELGDEYISSGTLFLALFDAKSGHTAKCLQSIGINRQQALDSLKRLRGGQKIISEDTESEADTLSRFTQDLTEMARNGELDPVIGREDEIGQIIQTLSRRKKNNPAIIGEAGVGKTVIVEGLAQRIASANVPDTLLNKRVLSLDMAEIVAGSNMRGEFESRLKAVRDAVIKAQGQVILFIDELHTVVGAGANAGGLDAPSMLKAALAQGSLQVIGADTLSEYRTYIEADKALERRFHPILIREPSVEQTLRILEGIIGRYESHHQTHYEPEALKAAAELSERYITDRCLPDKAVDLVDEAGAHKHILLNSMPPQLKQLELDKQRLQQEKTAAFNSQRFEQTAELQMEIIKLEAQLKTEHECWIQQRSQTEVSVTANDIAAVVSRWTGIPVTRMLESEADKLARMELKLHQRIVGQQDAVRAVANAIRRNRTGITDTKRPIGSFLFLGPTGVGKTELARALAAFLLDDESRIVRLDMSEYMERHEVSKIIGAPPGYIGYGEGGQLTEKVRRNPYTVVLLDEMEKAHPDVFNILLQILEEGHLTDAQGRVISFRNTILIGTSNLGTEALSPDKRPPGFIRSTTPDYHAAKQLVMREVRRFFKPEFLNRLDDIIVFHYLEKSHVHQITQLFIDELIQRMQLHQISLKISAEVVEKMTLDGFNPVYGARPLRREVERQIENPLAMKIVEGECPEGSEVAISIKEGVVAFAIQTPLSGRASPLFSAAERPAAAALLAAPSTASGVNTHGPQQA
ncbi:MAG: ATP-dependent Clp protease ATP-binding subunit ClpC [Motiliproteus sp.]|jgi:ATP-dependent Clp protease ATP-binding subunit ClpC